MVRIILLCLIIMSALQVNFLQGMYKQECNEWEAALREYRNLYGNYAYELAINATSFELTIQTIKHNPRMSDNQDINTIHTDFIEWWMSPLERGYRESGSLDLHPQWYEQSLRSLNMFRSRLAKLKKA